MIQQVKFDVPTKLLPNYIKRALRNKALDECAFRGRTITVVLARFVSTRSYPSDGDCAWSVLIDGRDQTSTATRGGYGGRGLGGPKFNTMLDNAAGYLELPFTGAIAMGIKSDCSNWVQLHMTPMFASLLELPIPAGAEEKLGYLPEPKPEPKPLALPEPKHLPEPCEECAATMLIEPTEPDIASCEDCGLEIDIEPEPCFWCGEDGCDEACQD